MAERARPHPGAGAVLALDMAAHTGWACCHIDGAIRSGAVTFDKRGGGGFRFLPFRAWLTNFKNAAGGLEAVWWERIEFISTVENARTKYGFEATLLAWCEHHGIPYTGIAPATIKKFITGSGRATKRDVMDAVRLRGHTVISDDEADALALLQLALERMECGRAA